MIFSKLIRRSWVWEVPWVNFLAYFSICIFVNQHSEPIHHPPLRRSFQTHVCCRRYNVGNSRLGSTLYYNYPTRYMQLPMHWASSHLIFAGTVPRDTFCPPDLVENPFA